MMNVNKLTYVYDSLLHAL